MGVERELLEITKDGNEADSDGWKWISVFFAWNWLIATLIEESDNETILIGSTDVIFNSSLCLGTCSWTLWGVDLLKVLEYEAKDAPDFDKYCGKCGGYVIKWLLFELTASTVA